MTYLELVNDVLARLREQQVTTVNLTTYSSLIGKFVNDMYTNGSSQSFAQMFVVVFIVGFIGMMLDRIMVVFQRLVSFDSAPSI